ncbi:MAG TPA: S9 family peptidase [Bryobacteraceae bacterium]|nr:S9 family peptidase [Bryobacteraceae bacterium]
MIRLSLVLFAALSSAALGAELYPPPANLKVEGVPPIPREALENLDRYSQFRSALLRDWHPTRREILIGTRFAETEQVHRVTMPGGARTQLTFAADRTAGAAYRPRSGNAFVYAKDTGGSEFFQLYLYDMATGTSKLLTDGKSRNTFGQWSNDGTQIGFTSTRRTGKMSDVWVMNPDNPASAKLAMEVNESGYFDVSDWSPDNKSLLVVQTIAIDTSTIYEVDAAAGTKRALTPAKTGVSYTDASYSPDGKWIYATTNERSDFMQLARIERASGKVEILRPNLNWDVSLVDVSDDGTLLAYTANEEGIAVLRILNTTTGADMKIPAIPAGVIAGLRWRPNSHEIGFTHTSARSAADVYSIEVDTGKLDRWTASETGGLNPSTFAEPELIRWKSFDGLGISGFLYKPSGRFTGARPVLINIHGGPEGQSRPIFLARANYFINELGIAMIYPNVRGSAGYGKKFLSMDNGAKREDSVKDIGALLDWIATRPDLDAKRVMVTGGSYGGYMTLASMTHFNDRLRGGIDVVGIANFVTFLERTEAYRRDLRRVEYGDERDPKMRDQLFTISPVKNAKKITKPMLIVQGRNDPRVPYTESEQMVEAIRGNGGPVWYLLAADEGHGFVKKSNQDYQMAAIDAFLKQHLLQ